MLPLQRERREAAAPASIAGSHTQLGVCIDFVFVLVRACTQLFVYLNMEVLECVYASAFVSVCPYHFA